MSDKIKKVCCIIFAILIIFGGGFLVGKYCYNRKVVGELSEELNTTKGELERIQQKYDEQYEQFQNIQQQFGEIGDSVNESLGILGQADESIERLGQSIQNLGGTITSSRELIECIKELNIATATAVGELQNTNRRLREELERIQRSSIK